MHCDAMHVLLGPQHDRLRFLLGPHHYPLPLGLLRAARLRQRSVGLDVAALRRPTVMHCDDMHFPIGTSTSTTAIPIGTSTLSIAIGTLTRGAFTIAFRWFWSRGLEKTNGNAFRRHAFFYWDLNIHDCDSYWDLNIVDCYWDSNARRVYGSMPYVLMRRAREDQQ